MAQAARDPVEHNRIGHAAGAQGKMISRSPLIGLAGLRG
jgi:hypothetical protein